MAIIVCEQCGKQISDKAVACPHCGAARTPAGQDPLQSVRPQRPQGNGIKIAAAIAAAALIVGAALCCGRLANPKTVGVYKGGSSDMTFSDRGGYSDYGVSSESYYDVVLDVTCRENILMNKYDVDILVDGNRIATLNHGGSNQYSLELVEGSHQVEFQINGKKFGGEDIYDPGDSGTFVQKTIRVDGDDTFSYYVKLTAGNNIQVEQRA